MKKRILSLLVSMVLLISVFATPASAAYTGEELYQKLLNLIEYYKSFSLFSDENADSGGILKQALIKLFDQDEANFDTVANTVYGLNDRYSAYIPAGSYESAYSFAPSRYFGIGVAMSQTDEGVFVTEVVSDTPAERAGIKPGDLITHINGAATKGMDISDVAELIRGEKDTFVTVTIKRNGQDLVVTMKREAIGQKNLVSEIKEDGIGYLYLPTFLNSESYLPEAVEALENFVRNSVKSVIIDLRDNGGGELQFMYHIANRLIPERDVSFLALKERTGVYEIKSTGAGINFNKIVFLVNNNTASASEVLAGALRDVEGAVIVGEKTYGKGMCQGHLVFSDNSAAVITTAVMILPSTGIYDEAGLVPDLELKNSEGLIFVPEMKELNAGRALYMTNYSPDTYALNERLAFLGYLDKPEYTYGSFDEATLAAVNAFQKDSGLAVENYCGTKTLRELADRMTKAGQTRVINDDQLGAALKIAREGLAQPLGYQYDAETDTFMNK